MDSLKDVARQICTVYNVHLSTSALSSFTNILQPIKLLRGKSPFEKGQVCPCMYFVKRGLVLQHYDKNGLDVVEHISREGDMVICIESYFTQSPCKLEVTMLEPGILYGIPYDEIFALAKESFEICQLLFAIQQRSLIISQHKADMLRFESAKERYKRTLKENPEIVRRSPLHYVASFLQMKPETLSRVRTQVMEEGL